MRQLVRQRGRRKSRKLTGVTLIELVIALVIIGISAATIASLLITALKFSQSNESYAERLRDAESCYETLLAVEEGRRWEPSQPENDCSSSRVRVTGARLDTWTKGNTYNQLFTDGGIQDICITQQPTCEPVTINGTPATKFMIPIKGKNNLQLVVP